MWGWGLPEQGDWVRATRTIPITLSDHLAGSGVRPGTMGVVLERTGSWVQVRFNTGWGLHEARVRSRDVRLARRGGGEAAFGRRTHFLTIIRISLALFLLWPIIWVAAVYVVQKRTTDGLLTTLAVGVAYGLMDYAAMAIAHPLQFLVYAAFLAVLGRIAFPRR